MVPSAPGLFSTITGLPSGFSMPLARAREATSVLPPAP
ncbi:Uncharacterised protein [Bordetella pertussis]|nr:Uncharacterised protein [Bordetella pertussis]CFV98685.1 Uncharacterised protein [Bordetella pertussis]CFW31490.1 Uncharacterised protein [Bordetella pertussis]